MEEINYTQLYIESIIDIIKYFYIVMNISLSIVLPLQILLRNLYESLLESLGYPVPPKKKLNLIDVINRSYIAFWFTYRHICKNKNIFGVFLTGLLYGLLVGLSMFMLIPGSIIAYILYLLVEALRFIWNLGIKDEEVEYEDEDVEEEEEE